MARFPCVAVVLAVALFSVQDVQAIHGIPPAISSALSYEGIHFHTPDAAEEIKLLAILADNGLKLKTVIFALDMSSDKLGEMYHLVAGKGEGILCGAEIHVVTGKQPVVHKECTEIATLTDDIIAVFKLYVRILKRAREIVKELIKKFKNIVC